MVHAVAAREGKAKILTPDGDTLRVTFKDSATAFNGVKKATIPGKGELNAQISAYLFEVLVNAGIATCFARKGTQLNELHYHPLTMIPLEVVVRNDAWGSLCKRFGLQGGTTLARPVVEFYVKNDELNDPQITDDMLAVLGYLPAGVTETHLKTAALAANEVLTAFFAAHGIRCADFKLEYGLNAQGQLVVGDELSPDNFRLRDVVTGQVLDKDVFRQDLADLVETYTSLWQRIQQPVNVPAQSKPYLAEVLVSSRKNILNPESKAILDALHILGQHDVTRVQASKHFTVALTETSLVAAQARARQLALDVLSNPVIEDVDVLVMPAASEGA
jgi:phosphoribosylaminoimidazole-succinocarboxamide synthase